MVRWGCREVVGCRLGHSCGSAGCWEVGDSQQVVDSCGTVSKMQTAGIRV